MFFVKDQIRRNVLVSSDHGIMIVNRFDGNENRVGHGHFLLDHGHCTSLEAQITHDCLKNIQEPVILDVGANIGTYATWIARAFPRGKIYCFEPQRLVFQMLCGNMAINNIDNVHAYNMALGSENKIIQISEPDYTNNCDYGTFSIKSDVIEKKSGMISTVPIMTVDTFCDSYDLNHVDFLKIDVEGMDLEVLAGSIMIIDHCRPTIFVEHFNNRISLFDDIKQFLEQYKYKLTVIQNNVLATHVESVL